MVKSRYLCSAPRPESWDAKAEALLKSLGGSATQQETMLRKTLDSLKVMHADKQKTGPGRKSNAEHAIAFYEYVLETITENQQGGASTDSSSSSSNGAAKVEASVSAAVPEEAVVPVKRKRGRPRKNPLPVETASQQQPPPAKKNRIAAASVPVHNNNDNNNNNSKTKSNPHQPTPGSSDDDHSYSVASMDTAEFINQHNDLCEVCNTGGELLMCSTCNLVFHLSCVRPKMDEAPPDSWVCAYCIMSGVKGLKQNSKMRKSAAVAVRLMARMRKQLQRQKNLKNHNNNSNQPKRNGSVIQEDDDSDEPEQPQKASATAKEGGSDASESSSSSDAEVAGGKEDDEKQPSEQTGESDAASVEETSSPSSAVKIEASASEESEEPATTTPIAASATPEQHDEEQQPPKKEVPVDANGDNAGNVAAAETVTSAEAMDGAPAAPDDVTPQKSNQELTTGTEEINPSTGRVRRQRKQANYYDPQSGPASHWKTDGANEWKYLSQQQHQQLQNQPSEDDEVDDVDDVSSEDFPSNGRRDRKRNGGEADDAEESPVSKKGSKKTGKTWCHFCNDDKDIPVCCFCACRVCFGKHNQTELLLCDNCDSEYHLSCLNPPLKSVPSSQSWFCPSCVEAAKQAKAKLGKRASRGSAEKASTPKSSSKKSVTSKAKKASPSSKKSTGKAKSPAAAELIPVKRGPGRPRKHPLPEPYSGPPRKRGRPPKTKSPIAAVAAPVFVAEPSVSPPVKKRGRPRKNPLPETAVAPTKKRSSSMPAPSTVKRGPGRPPKNASKSGSRSPAPKKSQEKKRNESKSRAKAKAVAVVKEEISDVVSSKQSAANLKSRSGRTVKQPSFHDEIDEGEQHLKSSRYAMQLQHEQQNGYYSAPVDPVAAAAQLAAYADAGAAVVADGGIQHVPAVYAVEEQQHHDVDPHFLESIPVGGGDLSHVAHLDTLAMDPALNLDAMHQEAMQMEAAMNLNTGLAQPHAIGESMHLEGDTKPAAVVPNPLSANVEVTNEVRPTPVVESLSTPPSTNLETNKNPASSTVANTAAPAVGNTVPAVGVLDPVAPKAEVTLKPAEPVEEKAVTSQMEKEVTPAKEKDPHPEKKPSPVKEAPVLPEKALPLPAKDAAPPASASKTALISTKATALTPEKEKDSASVNPEAPVPASEAVLASADVEAAAPEKEAVSALAKDKVPQPAKSAVSVPEVKVAALAEKKAASSTKGDAHEPDGNARTTGILGAGERKPAPPPVTKPAPMLTAVAVPPNISATVESAAAAPRKPAAVPVVAASPQTGHIAAVPDSTALPHTSTVAAAVAAPNTRSTANQSAVPPQGAEAKGDVQSQPQQQAKVPRRKPGARECMQISRRFGVNVIPDKYIEILEDYCKRGKVEHLIRMRERLDEHSRFLESQLAGLESLVEERGESDAVVPAMPESEQELGE